MTDSIEFHQYDDWTAVYLNGNLVRVGDSYLADEWLQSRFGVKVVQDDAFLRGGNSRDGVAQTLDELAAYRAERDERHATAARLRAEAQALLERASEMDSTR